MRVAAASVGVSPVLPPGHAFPSCTDCRQPLLVGEAFLQPEGGPPGKREPPRHMAGLLNLAQPQLFAVMGEDHLPQSATSPSLNAVAGRIRVTPGAVLL